MERVEARIRPDQKERIERAADIRGTSVSDFIIQNADEAAKKTIEEQNTWVLRGQDAVAFLEMLENPPAPGPRLKAAFKRFTEEKRLRERKAS
jgi:uncharacterized protein (DUF1778 family)